MELGMVEWLNGSIEGGISASDLKKIIFFCRQST